MTPEEVAIRYTKTEDVDIDFKRYNNFFPTKKKKRTVERCQKRIVEKLNLRKKLQKQ